MICGTIAKMENNSKIASFYENRSIFLTGGTGFLGAATIEKLLRSCPGISKLYILIRPKRCLDIHMRLAKLLECSIFDQVSAENPEALSKIIPIAGDINLPDLGISEEDRARLCEKVSIVIHSAATVRFDEKLKIALNTNVCGTQRIIRLAKQMNLVAIVYVSTVYSNCQEKFIPESIRPLPFDTQKLIECVQSLDDHTGESITHALIGNRPNTYTFSKALAENLLEKEKGLLPICIVRPSIVTAIYKDPMTMAGWTNNINGATGFIAGYGKGVLRSVWAHVDKVTDLIPLDYVVNAIIASAWKVGTADTMWKTIPVYNCCSGSTKPITMLDFKILMKRSLNENPFIDILWYPSVWGHRTLFAHQVFDFSLHYLPAILISTLTRFGQHNFKVMKLYEKINKTILSLHFFWTHEWDIEYNMMPNLYDGMCPQDKILFSLDVKEINWEEYMKIYCLGVRKYILNQDPNTLPAARKKLRKLYLIDKTTKFGLILLLCALILLLTCKLW